MSKTRKHIVIETNNLTIGYQQKKANKVIAFDVSLLIEKGKLVALIGENGIGKSTLIRTISKVQNQLSGKIFLKGKDLTTYTNKELSTNLSLVLTEKLPESQLTVFELIALGRQPYTNWVDSLSETDVQKINNAMQLTEVLHLQSHRFYELSDGQLQRVLIARALAQDTDVVILDEPTAHLDMHHTFKIFQLLKKLVATTQKTIIISTHQINLALEIVDDLIIMKSNEVISGDKKELLTQNKLQNLFPEEILTFNKQIQQFVINRNE
ncbi:MAG: ABC transporter ATP-binding protein [Polaribacter sp.]|nr:ABC transporter ATP-binding protein [Polaribacter sp.]MDG1810506.1 ABC transporter ATP-binding protein [Polaribacter sp.]MDG1993543.1 ABC transporter ATP-binding protein [Polaribacter sp.]